MVAGMIGGCGGFEGGSAEGSSRSGEICWRHHCGNASVGIGGIQGMEFSLRIHRSHQVLINIAGQYTRGPGNPAKITLQPCMMMKWRRQSRHGPAVLHKRHCTICLSHNSVTHDENVCISSPSRSPCGGLSPRWPFPASD